MTHPTWLVWAIDDLEDNLEMVRNSLLPEFSAWLRVEGFLCPETALRELGERRARAADLPHVILMDFFLGKAYGSEVTREIRVLFAPEPGPVIIGHSSAPSASRAIVEAGGDFIVPKRREAVSFALREVFGDPERVAEMLRMRRNSQEE